MTIAEQPQGSTASTNAKAATFILLVKGTAVVLAGIAVYAVIQKLEGIVGQIVFGWLGFLAAFGGINYAQHKADRESDWTALRIKAGAPATSVQNVSVASGGSAQVSGDKPAGGE